MIIIFIDIDKKESRTSDRRREEIDRDKESKRESRSYVPIREIYVYD